MVLLSGYVVNIYRTRKHTKMVKQTLIWETPWKIAQNCSWSMSMYVQQREYCLHQWQGKQHAGNMTLEFFIVDANNSHYLFFYILNSTKNAYIAQDNILNYAPSMHCTLYLQLDALWHECYKLFRVQQHLSVILLYTPFYYSCCTFFQQDTFTIPLFLKQDMSPSRQTQAFQNPNQL